MKQSHLISGVGALFALQISFIAGMIYFHFFDPHTQITQVSNLQQFSNELVDISAKINPALVSIIAKQDIDFYEANPWYSMHNGTKKQLSGGSGFFVLGGKYVLTSAHVVESPSSEYIVVISGARKLDAKMVWSDASGSDLALLQVYDEEHNLYMHHAFLDIALHNNIHPGSVVLAFGNPFLSLPNTMSMGVVSAIDRTFTTNNSSKGFIQIDATIQPGSSGGPLVGLDGRVVGINTAIIDTTPGVSFATPILQQELIKIEQSLGK